MVPLWFTLSALCFVGAGVLLYVDIDRRRGRSRRRKSWARSHGFDYERESADILKRWKRGVMSTVGDGAAFAEGDQHLAVREAASADRPSLRR